MKKNLLLVLAFVAIPSTLWASTWTSYVHDVLEHDVHDTKIFADGDGRVLRIKKSQTELIESVKEAFLNGEELDFEVTPGKGERLYISKISRTGNISIESPMPKNSSNRLLSDIPYYPTNLSSRSSASSYFNGLHRSFRNGSQCYRRAHIWATEMYQQGVSSEKVFIFFSRAYIRRFNFDWWFHVAPVVTANSTRYVMDRSFFKGPRTLTNWGKRWTNKLSSSTRCKMIEKYSGYTRGNSWCYMAVTPMYFYQPLDIKNYERKGTRKQSFYNWTNKNKCKAFSWWKRNQWCPIL